MTTTTGSVVPVLRRTPNGWLAVSPPDVDLRFAVAGSTEDEATALYHRSYEQWREAQKADVE